MPRLTKKQLLESERRTVTFSFRVTPTVAEHIRKQESVTAYIEGLIIEERDRREKGLITKRHARAAHRDSCRNASCRYFLDKRCPDSCPYLKSFNELIRRPYPSK